MTKHNSVHSSGSWNQYRLLSREQEQCELWLR